MGKLYPEITSEIADWVKKQKLFFVATAPLSGTGHINCSPKGYDSFRILDKTTVVYQDLTGSGAETIAHVRENGRIVIMFCAFEGPPKIFRFYGTGTVITQNDKEFESINRHFKDNPGIRSYIKVDIDRITDSCGYGVPLYKFESDRETMQKWADNKGKEGIKNYQIEKNSISIDGLKAL